MERLLSLLSSDLSVSIAKQSITPPPAGLTNLQSKVISPLLTAHPDHAHWDVQLSHLDADSYAPGSLNCDEGVLDLPFFSSDSSSREASFVLAKESTVVVYNEEDYAKKLADAIQMFPDVVPQVLQDGKVRGIDALRSLKEVLKTKEAREVILPLCVPAGVLVQVEDYGHHLERLLSTALVGSPCCWPAINKELVAVLRSNVSSQTLHSTILQYAAASTEPSIKPEEAAHFVEYVERGRVVPQRIQTLLIHAAAMLLSRPIVVVVTKPEGKESSTLFHPHVPGTPNGGGESNPIVIEDSCVVVRCGVTLIGASSPHEVQFAHLPSAIVAILMDHPQSNPASGNLLSCFSDSIVEVQYCTGDRVTLPVAIEAPARAHILGAHGNSLHCGEMGRDAHGCFSFATFPAAYFPLSRYGHEAEVSKTKEAFEFGEDVAAAHYLETLKVTNVAVLKADCDGHCLLHAVSRFLTGGEYLWHPLRHALYAFMSSPDGKEQLRKMFQMNFFLEGIVEELDELAQRAHPDYPFNLPSAPQGTVPISTVRGLGDEHIFALACILRRPILLLDRPADAITDGRKRNVHSCLFLPLNILPEQQVTQKLLTIGWYDEEHRHYVAVVPALGTVQAAISTQRLPRNEDESITVYAAPSDKDSTLLALEYLGDGSSGSGLDTVYEIGGEMQFDCLPWLRRHVERFEAACQGTTIWALYEFLQAIDSAEDLQTAGTPVLSWLSRMRVDQLACIPNMGDFTKVLVEILSNPTVSSFGVCSSCTRTFVSTASCPRCFVPLKKFHRTSGQYVFKDRERIPLPSSSGSIACSCGHKHWCSVPHARIGSQVWARNLCSYFSPATVIGIDDGTYDLEFRFGHRRFCVLPEDVVLGYPVDFGPSPYVATSPTLLKLSIQICHDSDPLLNTKVEDLDELIAAAIVAQNLEKAELPAANLVAFKKTMTTIINQAKPVATLTVRTPIFQDAGGNDVEWQWLNDFRTYEPYHRAANGAIEAAFQNSDLFTKISVPHWSTPGALVEFEIDLSRLEQVGMVNTRRMRRCISQPRPWDCTACTFLHTTPDQMLRTHCEMCGGVRGDSPLTVTHRSRQEQEEERLQNVDWGALQQNADADPRLAAGGELYRAAFTQFGAAAGLIILKFPACYPDSRFFFSGTANRFVLLPPRVPAGHPLLATISGESMATNVGGAKWRGVAIQFQDDGSIQLLDYFAS